MSSEVGLLKNRSDRNGIHAFYISSNGSWQIKESVFSSNHFRHITGVSKIVNNFILSGSPVVLENGMKVTNHKMLKCSFTKEKYSEINSPSHCLSPNKRVTKFVFKDSSPEFGSSQDTSHSCVERKKDYDSEFSSVSDRVNSTKTNINSDPMPKKGEKNKTKKERKGRNKRRTNEKIYHNKYEFNKIIGSTFTSDELQTPPIKKFNLTAIVDGNLSVLDEVYSETIDEAFVNSVQIEKDKLKINTSPVVKTSPLCDNVQTASSSFMVCISPNHKSSMQREKDHNKMVVQEHQILTKEVTKTSNTHTEKTKFGKGNKHKVELKTNSGHKVNGDSSFEEPQKNSDVNSENVPLEGNKIQPDKMDFSVTSQSTSLFVKPKEHHQDLEENLVEVLRNNKNTTNQLSSMTTEKIVNPLKRKKRCLKKNKNKLINNANESPLAGDALDVLSDTIVSSFFTDSTKDKNIKPRKGKEQIKNKLGSNNITDEASLNCLENIQVTLENDHLKECSLMSSDENISLKKRRKHNKEGPKNNACMDIENQALNKFSQDMFSDDPNFNSTLTGIETDSNISPGKRKKTSKNKCIYKTGVDEEKRSLTDYIQNISKDLNLNSSQTDLTTKANILLGRRKEHNVDQSKKNPDSDEEAQFLTEEFQETPRNNSNLHIDQISIESKEKHSKYKLKNNTVIDSEGTYLSEETPEIVINDTNTNNLQANKEPENSKLHIDQISPESGEKHGKDKLRNNTIIDSGKRSFSQKAPEMVINDTNTNNLQTNKEPEEKVSTTKGEKRKNVKLKDQNLTHIGKYCTPEKCITPSKSIEPKEVKSKNNTLTDLKKPCIPPMLEFNKRSESLSAQENSCDLDKGKSKDKGFADEEPENSGCLINPNLSIHSSNSETDLSSSIFFTPAQKLKTHKHCPRSEMSGSPPKIKRIHKASESNNSKEQRKACSNTKNTYASDLGDSDWVSDNENTSRKNKKLPKKSKTLPKQHCSSSKSRPVLVSSTPFSPKKRGKKTVSESNGDPSRSFKNLTEGNSSGNCSLINESILEEVQCQMIASEAELMRLKMLDIKIDWELSPLHEVDTGSCKVNMTNLKNKLHHPSLLNENKFTKEEEDKIKQAWEEFSKMYDFCNPELFAPTKQTFGFFGYKQKHNFKLFLAKYLPDRRIFSVYNKFLNIYIMKKKGRWSDKEDRLLLDIYFAYNENCSTHEGKNEDVKFGLTLKKMMTSALNRTLSSVDGRLKILLENEHARSLIQRDVIWTPELEGTLVHNLIKKSKVKSVEELRHACIPYSVWRKISNKIEIPIDKLLNQWKYHLYPQLFARHPVVRSFLQMELIKWFYKSEIRNWELIDWSNLSRRMGDLGSCNLYRTFRTLVSNYVPKSFRNSFRESVVYLHEYYLPILEKKSTSHMLARKYYDPETRTLKFREEDEEDCVPFSMNQSESESELD